MIAIGIMSGTSGDGVDAVAIELEVPAKDVRVLAAASVPYPKNVREAVLALGEGGMASAADIARLHGLLGDRYAEIALGLCDEIRPKHADVIAMHGQTVAHLPEEHATFQIGDAARVAHRTGIPVIDDLRSADVAAGGHGAPLVSFADFILFARLAPVAVLNIGGIANLTLIPTARAEDVTAFDTGPGNMVIDGIAASIGATHDIDGAGARRGKVDDEALSEFLGLGYFSRHAPKTAGREQFGSRFAARLLELVVRHGGTHDDALATATALTARTIVDALERESKPVSRVLVAGGGARNPTLLAMVQQAIAPTPLEPADRHGVPATHREAIAFAILGAYRLRGLPNTLPRATGAKRAVSGGALHIP